MVLRTLLNSALTKIKTEVHKYKRERAMGERNTALAVAVGRHMNLMWHNISKGCRIGNYFSIAAALTYIALGMIDSRIVPSQQRKAYVLMFFCLK